MDSNRSTLRLVALGACFLAAVACDTGSVESSGAAELDLPPLKGVEDHLLAYGRETPAADVSIPCRLDQYGRIAPGQEVPCRIAPAQLAGRFVLPECEFQSGILVLPQALPCAVSFNPPREPEGLIHTAEAPPELSLDELIPVDPATEPTVAVVGRLARVPNLGDGGSSDVSPRHTITPLDGLTERYGADRVRHSDSDVSIAADADVAVVVVGYTKDDEGEFLDADAVGELMAHFPPTDHPLAGSEAPYPSFPAPHTPFGGDAVMATGGDRRSLRLSDDDERLIAEVAAVNDQTVVVVMSGSAVVMPFADDVSAVLQLWYPGQEGGAALAEVMSGGVAPSGRLPFAIPRHESDLVPFDPDADTETYGLFHGQWHLDRTQTPAHFPFGYGLTTTTFEITEARWTSDAEIEAVVSNTGGRPAAEVVQVYASVEGSAFERPRRRLVGFARRLIEAGDTARISVAINRTALWVRSDGELAEEPGVAVRWWVAHHAADPGVEVVDG